MVHLVLTRFNLKVKFGENCRSDSILPKDKPWINEEYLDKRFEIFDKYTFPCFKNQSCQNFKWIVLFHKNTPKKFLEKIDSYKREMSNFVALFFDDDESEGFKEIVQQYIVNNYAGEDVITSRVDNDDAVGKSFIEEIQKQIREKNCEQATTLSLINGLQFDTRKNVIIKYYYENNHFLSLYTPKEKNGLHCLMYRHDIADSVAREEQFDFLKVKTRYPLWCEIITNNNVANDLHWTLGGAFIPYKIKDEYTELDFGWKSKIGWFFMCLCNNMRIF